MTFQYFYAPSSSQKPTPAGRMSRRGRSVRSLNIGFALSPAYFSSSHFQTGVTVTSMPSTLMVSS